MSSEKKENEFFVDANEEETDIEAVNYDSESSHENDGGSYDELDRNDGQPESFSSQQWPQTFKYSSSSC